jgi:hypothetical protein
MAAVISRVDAYRDDFGVEPICRVFKIAPSTYHDTPLAVPSRRRRWRVSSATLLSVEIKRVLKAGAM